MKHPRAFLTGLAACALLIMLSGCAGNSVNWPTSPPGAPTMDAAGKPFPNAQMNCISIKQATPSQFVCNGKVYTANQLRDKREDWAKGS